jgi:hypothetical protein
MVAIEVVVAIPFQYTPLIIVAQLSPSSEIFSPWTWPKLRFMVMAVQKVGS